MSKTFFICCAAPSKLRRAAVSASATTKLMPKAFWCLVGKRFAHQRFADSLESIRANRFAEKYLFLKHLARFARIASSLRFALKFARFASNPRCYSLFWNVDSQIANWFAQIGPLSFGVYLYLLLLWKAELIRKYVSLSVMPFGRPIYVANL